MKHQQTVIDIISNDWEVENPLGGSSGQDSMGSAIAQSILVGARIPNEGAAKKGKNKAMVLDDFSLKHCIQRYSGKKRITAK